MPRSLRRPLVPVLAPLLATLGGCPVGDPGADCTTEARASVQVTVVDEGGAAIPDAQVAYTTADGGGGACDAVPDGRWVCGWEVAGTLTIEVQADGYAPEEVAVEVPAGECHVESQDVTVTLGAVDCTDVELPAVELHVTAPDGSPVPEARGYYVPSDEDWTAPGACDPQGDGVTWLCGWELSGDLDVWVDAPGYFTWSETIAVGHDGCHPVREVRDVVLEPQ